MVQHVKIKLQVINTDTYTETLFLVPPPTELGWGTIGMVFTTRSSHSAWLNLGHAPMNSHRFLTSYCLSSFCAFSDKPLIGINSNLVGQLKASASLINSWSCSTQSQLWPPPASTDALLKLNTQMPTLSLWRLTRQRLSIQSSIRNKQLSDVAPEIYFSDRSYLCQANWP